MNSESTPPYTWVRLVTGWVWLAVPNQHLCSKTLCPSGRFLPHVHCPSSIRDPRSALFSLLSSLFTLIGPFVSLYLLNFLLMADNTRFHLLPHPVSNWLIVYPPPPTPLSFKPREETFLSHRRSFARCCCCCCCVRRDKTHTQLNYYYQQTFRYRFCTTILLTSTVFSYQRWMR